jgi:hypothetical protein
VSEPAEQQIRNIIQTHQERPIIKMAPDAVVYIDGLPFLINDYIGDGGVVVNFNDFVTSINGAVDTETFIPQATITLSVPADLRSLFQAPGGNRIIRVMSEVKIFAKGYYLTAEGDSVYHRVFWGVIGSVNHADNRRTMEISISCKGILHLFDIMQINLAPSVMNSEATGSTVTPMVTRDSNLNPFEAILRTFLLPLKDDVIDTPTVYTNDTATARKLLNGHYVDKWNNHLLNLQKSVRLFGFKPKKLEDAENPSKPAQKANAASPQTDNQSGAQEQKKSESDRQKDIIDTDQVRRFLPDFRIGSINLTQSTITSRLSRIRELAAAMGYEGYQDLDGSVIIKPPLYNLDSNLTDQDPNRNPFVINLSEIIGTDTELEDESQVRLTRLDVCGTIGATPLVEAGEVILPHASFMDPGLIRQFGLRAEPTRQMGLIANNTKAYFAYAVSELNKMNKRWRTYTCTIPFRPELRLGFPIYVPHLDIYAYLENISWNYTRGGQCTMTLGTTSVRWREMFAKPKTDSKTKEVSWVFTAVPDLVFAWTKAPTKESPNSKGRLTDPKGTPATKPVDAESKLTDDQKQQLERQRILTKLMDVESDTQGSSWRVQDDTAGFYKTAKPVDDTYYKQVRTVMPYTDGKGYTQIRPFPWGRHIKLEEALDLFTRHPSRHTLKLLPFESKDRAKTPGSPTPKPPTGPGTSVVVTATASDPMAYIMSGLGTPSVSSLDPTKGGGEDTKVLAQLNTIHDMISPDRADPSQKDADAIICFTLRYDEAFDTATLAKNENEYNQAASDATNAVQTPTAGNPIPEPDPAKIADEYVRGVITTNSGTGEFSQ